MQPNYLNILMASFCFISKGAGIIMHVHAAMAQLDNCVHVLVHGDYNYQAAV